MRTWSSEHPVLWLGIVVLSASMAALLQQPLLRGNGWSIAFTAAVVGLPFAALVSVLSILSSAKKDPRLYRSEIVAFAILWLGMPFALAAGGAAVGFISKTFSPLRDVSLSRLVFYGAALIISGTVWAFALTLWLKVRRGLRLLSVYAGAFFSIIAAGIIAGLPALATGHLLYNPGPLFALSLSEQIASSIYLLTFTRVGWSGGLTASTEPSVAVSAKRAQWL